MAPGMDFKRYIYIVFGIVQARFLKYCLPNMTASDIHLGLASHYDLDLLGFFFSTLFLCRYCLLVYVD